MKQPALPITSESEIHSEEKLGGLYFAYGSNLNIRQMKKRAPSARILGASYLVGWRLIFRGVADIARGAKNDLLPIGIWKIQPEDEEALDIYEGWPRVYRKVRISGIMTYRMNQTGFAPPSDNYFTTIEQGYNDFGLDTKLLRRAREYGLK
jgi:hypothetical protein